MTGGIGWNLRISGVERYKYNIYLMFLSQEIDIKLCQNYTKTHICIMSPVLSPMAVQYYCHMSLSVSRDRLNCHLRGFWSRDNEVFFTYTLYMFLYDFNTVVCQFLVTWTSIGCLIVQLLRFSGFSLINPISFFLYSPFKSVNFS